MKGDTEYKYLIVFVIFLAIKKMVAFTVEAKFPTYQDLDKASTSWKVLIKIRNALNLLSLLFASYFLYNYKFTFSVMLIFWIVWIRAIFYFLIDDQLVWLFINKTHKTRTIVHDLNTYGDSVSDFLIALVAVYALAKIFAPK
jgi:hypothetical protein